MLIIERGDNAIPIMNEKQIAYISEKIFCNISKFFICKGELRIGKRKEIDCYGNGKFPILLLFQLCPPPLETARFFFCCPVATFCTNISELWQRSLKNFDKLNVENAEEKEKTAKPHKKSTVRWRCHGEVSLLGRGTRRKETTASPWQL